MGYLFLDSVEGDVDPQERCNLGFGLLSRSSIEDPSESQPSLQLFNMKGRVS